MNGDFFNIREGVGLYMQRFYNGLVADTSALQEFVSRGFPLSVVTVPDRMVDSVEEMLATYQRNRNNITAPPESTTEYTPGRNALFPIIFVAFAKDFDSADAAFGQRMVERVMVRIDDDEDASVYGYRQAMGGQRVQIAILASDSNTAKSIAAQFAYFVGLISNRRFTAPFRWGQYMLQMPVLLESPDLLFAPVATEAKSMTILVTDLQLKVIIPYLDAPRPGELNDGTDHNPPGYPVLQRIDFTNHTVPISTFVEASGAQGANKTGLGYWVFLAGTLSEDDYSAGSWSVLAGHVETGNELMNDDEAGQTAVDNASDAIRDAITALVSVVTLKQWIAQADSLTEDEYTPESWSVLAAAVSAGVALVGGSPTPQQVTAATSAIRDAIDGLAGGETP